MPHGTASPGAADTRSGGQGPDGLGVGPGRTGVGGWLRSLDWRDYVIYIGIVVVYAIFAILLHSDGFTTGANLLNIFRQTAMISVMAVVVTYVIAAAEIDLSVGAVAGLASVTTAMGITAWGLVPGLLVGLATGAAAGAVNGGLVALVRIPSFLVTLGMMGVASGTAMWISASAPQPILNDTFNAIFGGGTVLGIPSLLVWVAVITAIAAIGLAKTRFGRHVLATGGNRVAAEYTGINTIKIKFYVLLASGIAAAIAGMLYAGRLSSGRYQWGEGDELSVIAAVILGGTSLFGGKGKVIGALFGSLLVGVVNNGLVLAGMDVSQQNIIRGVIIIVAVALARRK